MKTAALYQDKKVLALLSKFLSPGSPDELKQRFAKAAKDLSETTCRIPVLGVQGAGKSSFLNAVLFGDILLPVDADETTCIPTEVRYGENTTPQATVVFSDGKRKEVPCTEKGLASFVHQEHNPGNKMQISHIEISYRCDLLKNGLVLVDLPGVGSLTLANQKTTLDYLSKSSAAIFLLRTVPPMTRSEAVFVRGALPLVNSVFWVQNQWTDESDDEVQDGCDQNERVIGEIAKQVHKPKEFVSRPTVVCVKRALDGKIEDDAKMIKESNLQPFMDKIVNFASDWRKAVQMQLHQEAIELVRSALQVAREKEKQTEQILAGKTDEARRELEEQYAAAEEVKKQNRDLTRQAEQFLSSQKSSLQNSISEECRVAAENLRNHVRTLIDQGLTGGARLSKAYNDCAKEVTEEVFQKLQEPFLNLNEGILQIIQEFKPVSLGRGNFSAKGSFSEKSKAPGHYGRIGGAMASIAGAAAGAKVGAALGTAIPIPGVGTVIGAVVGGLLGGLLGSFTGRKVAEVQVDCQRETARTELFQQIEHFRSGLEKSYQDTLEEFVKSIHSALRDWNKKQNQQLEQEYEARNAEFSANQKEVKKNLELLQADLKELDELLTSLSNG